MMNIPETNVPRVVIVGGGFGGLKLAQKLSSKDFQVVLIDKNNFHTFQPLLYQVATAGLEADSIAYPIRKIFAKRQNVSFRMAEVRSIDTSAKTIETNIGSTNYDYLVLASGSATNFFGNKSIEELSMPMKSVSEALDLRSLILQNYEEALLTDDLKEREALLSYVIVGAGPTGVELAGALAELKTHVLPNDYPELDIRRMSIHLVEAAPRILAAMSEVSSSKAKNYLTKMGVQVWTDTLVEDYDGLDVHVSGNKNLEAKTLIWAAGVQGQVPNGLHAEQIGKGKRIVVDEINRVVGSDSIFAIGDVALMKTDATPNGYPMLAPVAVQQADLLAKNLLRILNKDDTVAFNFKNKGTMATVGRNKAVVELPSLKFQGFMAWLTWVFIHLVLLVGFRNKLIALVNWWWSYLNYDRGVRLIVRPFDRKRKRKIKKVEVL